MKFLPFILLTRNNYSHSHNATNSTFHTQIVHEHTCRHSVHRGQTQKGKHVCYEITSIFLLSFSLFDFLTFLKAALGGCGNMPVLQPFSFSPEFSSYKLWSNACKVLAAFSTVCSLRKFNGGAILPHILQHLFCSLCRIPSFSIFCKASPRQGHLRKSPRVQPHVQAPFCSCLQ